MQEVLPNQQQPALCCAISQLLTWQEMDASTAEMASSFSAVGCCLLGSALTETVPLKFDSWTLIYLLEAHVFSPGHVRLAMSYPHEKDMREGIHLIQQPD